MQTRYTVVKYNNEVYFVRFGRRTYYTRSTREAAQELANHLNEERDARRAAKAA